MTPDSDVLIHRGFWRWFWGLKPLCDWCERDRHVHDVLTGRCLHANRGCECEVPQ